MNPLIFIVYIIPIVFILLRRFVNPWLLILILVIGFLISYFFYKKSKDKNLASAIIFYCIISVFILISTIFETILLKI